MPDEPRHGQRSAVTRDPTRDVGRKMDRVVLPVEMWPERAPDDIVDLAAPKLATAGIEAIEASGPGADPDVAVAVLAQSEHRIVAQAVGVVGSVLVMNKASAGRDEGTDSTSVGADPEQAGSVFAITGSGSRGLPEPRFKG